MMSSLICLPGFTTKLLKENSVFKPFSPISLPPIHSLYTTVNLFFSSL